MKPVKYECDFCNSGATRLECHTHFIDISLVPESSEWTNTNRMQLRCCNACLIAMLESTERGTAYLDL